MSSREDFDRVGELLGEACEAVASPNVEQADSHRGVGSVAADSTKAPRELARMIAGSWAEVVGAEVAENATPVRLTRGSLVVSTSSSVWADTLGYMSADLVARLNEHIGEDAVSDMVFRHAGWEERPRPRGTSGTSGPAEQRRLTEEEEQAVAKVEDSDLPPALRQRAAQAMRRSLERSRRNPVR